MTFDELLAGVEASALEHEQRALAAVEALTAEQINTPVNGEWSVGKVLKHLCMADEPYLDAVETALANPRAAAGSDNYRHTLVGKLLIRASGPGANTPAPKFMVPPDASYSKEIIEEWKSLRARLRDLAIRAKGADLSAGVRNPFMKFFRMNLGDLFAVMDVHTERHVGQIEERANIARNP
jgi:hypothetical protein